MDRIHNLRVSAFCAAPPVGCGEKLVVGQTDLVRVLHWILDCSRARVNLSAEDIQWLVGIGLSPDGLGHSLARSFPVGRALLADD